LCWGAGSLAKGHRDSAVPFSFVRQNSAGGRKTSVQIDLNADVGEAATSEGRESELAVLASVSSVNIACGAHAGDADTMRRTIDAALAGGLAIGAHPGYADRDGLGRRELTLSPADVTTLVLNQILLLAAIASTAHVRLVHVKPHGALYNQAVRDRALASAIAGAVRQADASLCFVGLAGSPMLDVAREAGLRVAAEAFADRAYLPDGSLVPRSRPGAVITHAEAVAAQARMIATERRVIAIDGSTILVAADTICLHGDTPGAATLARHVRSVLEASGVAIRALAHARQP
jgi:5-oxoprolinase (ATP-hydrolysing) subunit A